MRVKKLNGIGIEFAAETIQLEEEVRRGTKPLDSLVAVESFTRTSRSYMASMKFDNSFSCRYFTVVVLVADVHLGLWQHFHWCRIEVDSGNKILTYCHRNESDRLKK